MANQVPQYADITLEFDNLSYNIGSTALNLNTVDNITLSVTSGHPSNTPIIILNKVSNPANFIINSNTSVTVILTSSQIGTNIGRYYVNLWVTVGGRNITHLPQDFDLVPTVNI